MKRLVGLLFLGCFISIYTGYSQVTAEDYARADSTQNFGKLVYHANPEVQWIEGESMFWYSVHTRKGMEYKMVDVEKQSVKAAFDQEKLCDALEAETKGDYKPYHLNLQRVRINPEMKTMTFVFNKHRWECSLKNYSLEDKGKVRERESRFWGNTEGAFDNDPVKSPDEKWEAFIREYNLFVKNMETDKDIQLSFDGSVGEFYSGHLVWSPDSKKIAINKIRPNEKHYFYMVESSPKDQVQPKLQKREYLKPGDALPIRKPSLFNVETREHISVNSQPFEHQFSLSNIKWWPESDAFTFEFNQRGHQIYQVAEVDAETGEVRIIIEEKSKTFIDYSGKRYRHDIDKTKEIVWASERDGWNHLYLVDAGTGRIKNQITSGNWVVRGVEHVDEDNRKIIFRGSGMNAGEDPYFIHYYSINFDGTGLKDLSPEKLNHSASFSSDHNYYTDTYSSVNIPPVTVLRKAEDGSVVMTLEKADISELKAEGWIKPKVFVAKARDGKTDIWGNIYFPTNFDPEKTYPVIEYIYAGPHGSFAQKSFRAYNYPFTGLAELGFIIVQMDGMGTSNRSKAFQDVCYQNLKDAGFPDRILWIKAAAKDRPYMDISRVGIFGGSAGGQSSTAALLHHPEFYKVAVSSCGCHDNRMDKIWWNEQWMGYPIGEHYAKSSNVLNAHKLQGDLMLIVGELDDNVDPASTMQVADALIKAGKDHELVVLPGMNHTLGGDYGEHKRRDFFVKSLYHQLPPKWTK